jgi:hypothetical protein
MFCDSRSTNLHDDIEPTYFHFNLYVKYKKDFSSSLFGLLFEWLTELIMLVRYMFMDQITDS